MLLRKLIFVVAFLLLPAAAASAQNIRVETVSDSGWNFPTYPASSGDDSLRAYVEAKQGMRYGIRVTNNTNRKIGLVIAVDGRNIISGDRSYLRNAERM
ncbi:hypothetical protein VU06_02270 [Desulfobulbus sp. F3]|nr:hypothetical protein [Desulfobulbus sp. F3]